MSTMSTMSTMSSMSTTSEMNEVSNRNETRNTRLNTKAAALAAIVLAGALARFHGISFGFPGSYHPDEFGAASAVSSCIKGRPVERRYRYPPLQVNLACTTERLLRPLTSRNPDWRPREILALRVVSATAGSAAIVFVYLLALHVVTPTAALGAAFLFACFPAAIATSKYGTPDSLLTMFLVLALWLQVRMSERGNGPAYFQAALATTLAVAAKYNGAFLAFSFVAAHLSAARSHGRPLFEWRLLRTTALAIALGLAIGFPSVLFGGEAAKLVGGVLVEHTHLATGAGHYGFALGPGQGRFVFHFQHSILPAAGPLLLAIVIAGLVAMALSRTVAAGVLLAFAVPYYATIEWIYKVPPSYERYVLPLVCVYLIAAALALERLATIRRADKTELGTARSLALAALLLAAGWFPLARSRALLAAINDDTRTRMGRWLHDNGDSLGLRGHIFVQSPTLRAYYPQFPGVMWFNSVQPDGPYFAVTTYVMASSLFYDRYLEFPRELPEWTAFYRRLFADGSLLHEEDVGAGRYMFHNPTLRLYRVEASPPPAKQPDPGAPQRGASTNVGQRSPDS